jgi:hypothetical protein
MTASGGSDVLLLLLLLLLRAAPPAAPGTRVVCRLPTRRRSCRPGSGRSACAMLTLVAAGVCLKRTSTRLGAACGLPCQWLTGRSSSVGGRAAGAASAVAAVAAGEHTAGEHAAAATGCAKGGFNPGRGACSGTTNPQELDRKLPSGQMRLGVGCRHTRGNEPAHLLAPRSPATETLSSRRLVRQPAASLQELTSGPGAQSSPRRHFRGHGLSMVADRGRQEGPPTHARVEKSGPLYIQSLVRREGIECVEGECRRAGASVSFSATDLIDCCCVSTVHISVMHASSSMHFPHACIQPAKAVVCLSKPK